MAGLVLNCQERQHLPALEVYKYNSPNLELRLTDSPSWIGNAVFFYKMFY